MTFSGRFAHCEQCAAFAVDEQAIADSLATKRGMLRQPTLPLLQGRQGRSFYGGAELLHTVAAAAMVRSKPFETHGLTRYQEFPACRRSAHNAKSGAREVPWQHPAIPPAEEA